MIPWRWTARDMARRTRTSLNGGLSVRMEMWVMTAFGYSTVWSRGRFCFSVSLIWTQSTRLMTPWYSQPRSYLPAMNAAMREALSSSTETSTLSM